MSEMTANRELLETFYEEARSLIAEMRKDISALIKAQSPEGKRKEARSSILSRLFRQAHAIKGSSAAMGFDDLRDTVQALENIFKAAKDEKLKLEAGVIPLLRKSIEACQKMMDKEKVADHKKLLEQLNNILPS
jgi:two-component system chemotaxis sensor kinase CheA